jgi:putative transposase
MDMSRFNGLRSKPIMSAHSYSRCWIHLIWGTLDREKLLNKTAAARVSRYLHEYAEDKGVYMKINYVNAEHVHTLVDLPTAFSIEELIQLLKGSSSHWVNSNDIATGKFAWVEVTARSPYRNRIWTKLRDTSRIKRSIVRTFAEELKEFIDRHGLCWKDEESC